MEMSLRYASFLLCLCAVHGAFDKADTDSFLNAALACRVNKNPGLTASAVKDGHVVFADGYGVADISTGRKVTNRTLFGIASMSKAFTATLMIKLLHDRGMSIYTKPGDILPEGFAYNTTEFTTYATVRDLMTHCLGVPTNQMMRLDKTLTRKEAARRIRYFPPVYKFRLHYLYSNLHYGIVSYLSEVLAGQPWEDLIRQYFYNPLGMHDSDFLASVDRKAKDVAQGYADDEYNGGLIPVPEELNKHWAIYAGSTGLMSSSADITRWMMMQMNEGRDEQGVEVIKAADLASTHSPQTAIRSNTVEKMFHRPIAPFTVTETAYAFGWKTGFYKGYKMLRHTGTTFGYSSLVTLLPEMNIGVFTSMTGEDENYVARTLIHSHILDTLLDEEPTINETTVCTYPEPWRPAVPHTNRTPIDKTLTATRALTQYEGTYNNIAYGDLTVTLNATLNTLQMEYGIGQWTLYPEHSHDTFSGEAFGLMYGLLDLTHVRFHMHSRTPDTLEIPGFESKDPPVFVKVSASSGTGGPSLVG